MDITEDAPLIQIRVEGSSFLPHQVRRMTGALLDVGTAQLTIEDVQRQIAGDPTAPTARALPPQGLCLVSVTYETPVQYNIQIEQEE